MVLLLLLPVLLCLGRQLARLVVVGVRGLVRFGEEGASGVIGGGGKAGGGVVGGR